MVRPLSTIHSSMAAAALATLNYNAGKTPKIHGVTLQQGGVAPRSVKTTNPTFFVAMSGPRATGAPSSSSQPNVATNTDAAKMAHREMAARKLTPADMRAASAAYKTEAMAHGNLAARKNGGSAPRLNALA
jgi:hypothetical protein